MEDSGLAPIFYRKDRKEPLRCRVSQSFLLCGTLRKTLRPLRLLCASVPLWQISVLLLFLGWSGADALLAAEFPQRYRLDVAQVASQSALTAYDLNLLAETLSLQRERLQNLFGQAEIPFPDIYIYASPQAFEMDLGVAWTIGGLSQGTQIYLKPLALLKSNGQLEPLLKHEYTHLFLAQRFPTLPLFLNEGTSAFLSGLSVPPAQPLPYAELLGCQEHILLNTPGMLLAYLASARYFVADVVAELGLEGFVVWLESADLKAIAARYRIYHHALSADSNE